MWAVIIHAFVVTCKDVSNLLISQKYPMITIQISFILLIRQLHKTSPVLFSRHRSFVIFLFIIVTSVHKLIGFKFEIQI